MEDRCIPKNIYICKFKVVIILLYNLFQLFNVYGLSPPIYAICPLASPYFTVPNIDYFWRVIKYAVQQSLSRLFLCKTFIANVKKNLALWQIFWHFIQRTLDCLVTLTHSQEMTVGCVYSPPNGTSVEWLQNAGQFVDGVFQLFSFRLRVSCKCFTCTLKYYTKAWKIRKWLLIKLTAAVCCLVSVLCLAVFVTLHPFL